MVSRQSVKEEHSKRGAIISAARVLFVTKGYESTTIADIAREAGVAVGTVYLYFRNKRELYTGVACDFEGIIAEAFEQPEMLEMSFEQIPYALIDALFGICHKYKALMTLLQIDVQNSEEELMHQESHQRIVNALDKIFQHAIEQGELAPFNTEMYASMLTMLGSEMMHQCFAIEKGEREHIYRASLLEFLTRIFFGPSLREGKQKQN